MIQFIFMSLPECPEKQHFHRQGKGSSLHHKLVVHFFKYPRHGCKSMGLYLGNTCSNLFQVLNVIDCNAKRLVSVAGCSLIHMAQGQETDYPVVPLQGRDFAQCLIVRNKIIV